MPRSRPPRSRIFHRLTLVLSIMALVLALPASAALAQHEGDDHDPQGNQAQNAAQNNGQNDQAQNDGQNNGQDDSAPDTAQNDQAQNDGQNNGQNDRAQNDGQNNGQNDQAQNSGQNNQAQGNAGTIKLSPQTGSVYPPNNAPQLPCTFRLDLFNYPESVEEVTATFTVHPPTSNTQGPGEIVVTDTVTLPHTGDGNPPLSGSETYDFSGLLDSYERHQQQGYHIKVTVDRDGEPDSRPADRKHKVFWIDCPAEGQDDEDAEPVALTVTKVSTADAGTTLSAAAFDLFQDDGDGVFNDADDDFLTACTTDADGVCAFMDLDPNSVYFLVETDAPANYRIIGDGVTAVTVGTSDTTRRIANAPIEEVAGSVTLSLTKVSSADATVTLQGAVFDLFRDEGDVGFDPEQDTRFSSCTTDAAGACLFSGLTPNTNFLLVETAAPDEFEIIGDGVTTITTVDEDSSITIENLPAEEVLGAELESAEGERGDARGPEGESGDGAQGRGQAPVGDDVAGGEQAPEGQETRVAGVAIDRAEGQAAPEARTQLAQTGLNGTTALALVSIVLMAMGMLLLIQPGWRPATVVLDGGPGPDGSQGDAPGPVSGHAEVDGMQRLLLGITLSAAGWSHVLQKPAWRRAAMARARWSP